MSSLKVTLLVSAVAISAWARPALADSPAASTPVVVPSVPRDVVPSVPRLDPKLDLSLPAASTWLWATPRANVASLGPVPILLRPYGYSGAATPLRATGAVVMGLGIMALFGAGVTGIVAAAQSSRLGDDCPGKVCYEGTRGADRLNSVRDTALAADWLVGIGAPVTASGVVMMLYSAVVDRYGLSPSPVFRASPSGGGLMFHF